MASGFELAGVVGTIDATINVTSRISTFISDFRNADDDADNLRAKLRLHKIALEQLNAGIRKHFEENSPTKEEQDFLTDLQPRMATLNESLNAQLSKMAKPKRLLISKAAWAASRKANMVSIATEIASWTNALQLIASVIQFNIAPKTTASSDSETQYTRLLGLFRHGDTTQQAGSAERSMEWKREDIKIIAWQKHQSFISITCGDQFLACAKLRNTTNVIVEWNMWGGESNDDDWEDWIVLQRKRLQEISCCLSWVDPQQTMLLKCLGYFFDESYWRFGLIYQIPEHMVMVREEAEKPMVTTLESLLVDKAFPACSLDQRVDFARNIATAILYVHATGWLHKDVNPRNIITLQDTRPGRSDMPVPYLVGSSSFRKVFWHSDLESHKHCWYFNIYRHPSRHHKEDNARYVMGFDAYSLGVILMELALCSLPEYQPLVTMKETFQGKKGEDILSELVKLLKGVGPDGENASRGVQAIMGRKYHEVVMYCLDRSDVEREDNIEFLKNVWIKLNDLELALF